MTVELEVNDSARPDERSEYAYCFQKALIVSGIAQSHDAGQRHCRVANAFHSKNATVYLLSQMVTVWRFAKPRGSVFGIPDAAEPPPRASYPALRATFPPTGARIRRGRPQGEDTLLLRGFSPPGKPPLSLPVCRSDRQLPKIIHQPLPRNPRTTELSNDRRELILSRCRTAWMREKALEGR